MINYIEEALKIQKQFLKLIENEDFNGIEDLLNKRKDFYLSYSKDNPEELKKFLNSDEFKESERRVNLAFNLSKEKVKKEINQLKDSSNASKQYQNNIARRSVFFNKEI